MPRGPRPNPSAPRSRHRVPDDKTIYLPAEGCDLPPPKLPSVRKWSAYERRLWHELWGSPQASQWDDSNIPAVAAMLVHYSAILAGTATAWEAQEYRHLATSLGLTPAGMKTLGWVIGDE